MKEKPKIVLFIGAPSTGKTSVLNYLIDLGYNCYEEISRQVVQDARKEGYEHLFKHKPLLFSEKLLKGRKRQFNKAIHANAKFVFIDRGLPDITAYLDMVNVHYPDEFNRANLNYKYNYVFWFPVWPKIHISDDERYEDLELSQKIEEHLKNSYCRLGYNLIEVPRTHVKTRVKFILSHLVQ